MDTNGKNVGVGDSSPTMDEKRRFECVEALKAMGLGEYLHIAGKHPWQWPEKFIIRDPQGKAIICRNGWAEHVAEVMSGILGRKIECIEFDKAGTVAVYTTENSVSIPERHTIAAMNRYFDEYRPGFHAGESGVTLPRALHALAAPVNFLEESDAYDLAAALKEVFHLLDVDVAATDEGFAVVLHDENDDLAAWEAERIAVIAEIAEKFSLTPKKKVAFEIGDDPAEWQIAVAGRHTQQQRIEDGINAILAHLGHPEAEGRESIAPKPGRGLDALIQPASKPSGKGKPKASA